MEITEAENGSIVKGSIIIKGKAWDDGDWHNATGILNWAYTLDTAKLDNGNHTIYARCYDGHDYSNVVSIQIEVKNKKGSVSGFEVIILIAAVAVVWFRKRKREIIFLFL